MIKRAMPTLLMAAAILVGAAITLRAPDFGDLGQFLTGASLSNAGVLAFAILLVWIILLVMVAGLVGSAMKNVQESEFMKRSWNRAILFVLSSILILGAGTYRHLSNPYPMCCGNGAQYVQEASHFGQ